ncbi:GNAT family N-acetyltransferase [Candidatus Bathyarchaeota archaeon]|nr:GNAT family N-acetyltransferase [Candidatus Bathyarchaeota archaeon]
MIKVILVPEIKLSNQQKQGIEELERLCFSDVDPKEGEECFCAESFARILAYNNNELVGHLILHKRDMKFDGRKVVLGGVVGACVTEHMRGRGIATKMMKKGLEVLRKQKCDVACLNADPVKRKTAYRLYQRLGFKLMKRKISFEDIHGNIRYDTGTMFILLRSKEIFNHIMNSNKTFHYGKGYW